MSAHWNYHILLGSHSGSASTGSLFATGDFATAAPPTDPLAGVTPNWDKNLPSASRFTTVFPGAVRDNNTGLVWEQAPDGAHIDGIAARGQCLNRIVPASGGTAGWRLPSIMELRSLQDLSLPAPFVPGSVFTGVQQTQYWSYSSSGDPRPFGGLWVVSFFSAIVSSEPQDSAFIPVWCVRGPMHSSIY